MVGVSEVSFVLFSSTQKRKEKNITYVPLVVIPYVLLSPFIFVCTELVVFVIHLKFQRHMSFSN